MSPKVDEQGAAQQALSEVVSAAFPAELFSQHRRATASTISHVRVAPNGNAQQRRESAFTTPTPAARLLERFGIKLVDVRGNPQVQSSARAEPASSARRPSAVGAARERSRSRPGQDAQPIINPHFADLLDSRTARPAASSPSIPAWRPGGGGPRAEAAAGMGTSGSAPQSASSFVSRAVAATAAKARETSRQVTGRGYSARLTAAEGRQGLAPGARSVASAGQVQGQSETPRRPSAAAADGAGKTSAASPSPPLQSAVSSPAALTTTARSLPTAIASRAAAAPPRPAGGAATVASSPAAARALPRALTYTEWLEAQTRTPAAPPQWRSPNDRAAAAAATASGPKRGSSSQTDPRAAGTHQGAAAAAVSVVPRTPPPIRPRTSKPGHGEVDTSSLVSTPTAHSPAATSGPPAVVRRLLLPSNGSSRELSFLEPGGSGDGRDSWEDLGNGGGVAPRLPGGFGSSDSSSLNLTLTLTNEPSITSLTAGGRLRIATRAFANGGGGSGPGSPAADGSSGRLVFPGAAAVAAAVSSLAVRRGGTAAAGSGGNEGGVAAGRSMARDAAPQPYAASAAAVAPAVGARGPAGRRGFGGGGGGGEQAVQEQAADVASARRSEYPAAFNGYKGVRLHDYLHHHHRQQYPGEGYESNETYAAGASTHPSERVEYGISGTETGSEVDEASDSASILFDDIVRQASVTGVMLTSPGGTLRRLSSRGGGSSAFARRPSSGASVYVATTPGAAAAAATAGSVPDNRGPQRRASGLQLQSGGQSRGQLPRAASTVTEGEVPDGGDGGVASAGGTLGHDGAARTEPGPPSPSPQSRTSVVQSSATRGAGRTSTHDAGSGSREAQARSAARTAVTATSDSGDGGVGSAEQGRSGALRGSAPTSDGATPALVAPSPPEATDSAAPQLARLRSFWLRMTSEWVPDAPAVDSSDPAVKLAGSSPRDGPAGGVAGTPAAGAGARGAGDDFVPSGLAQPQRPAPASPPQGPAAVPASPPRRPNTAARPDLGPELAGVPQPPLPPPPVDDVGCTSPRPAPTPQQQQMQQRQLYRQLTVDAPPSSPSLPLPPTLHHYGHQPPTPQRQRQPPSPTGWSSSRYGSESSDGRQVRSLSAPRASIVSMASACGERGSPGPGPTAASGGAARLTSLAQELRDSVRSTGTGTRPAWAMSFGGSGRQLLLQRGSHGALPSPVPSEAAGAGRGSISGVSTFSALSGPQAGVMYDYPSHGYLDRGAEYGRWGAAVMQDMDLCGSMQLGGHPSPDEYDDPAYLTRSQSSLPSQPPSGSFAKPFAPVLRPSSGWPCPGAAAAIGEPPEAAGAAAGSPGVPPPAGTTLPAHRFPLRRTVSASAAMLAAAAANAAAQAGWSPGPGASHGPALSSRLPVRSSRSWSPLRFPSTWAGRQAAPGSPHGRHAGNTVLDALDQILEEESSSRLSSAMSEQPIPDAKLASQSAGSVGVDGGASAAGGSSSVPGPFLTSTSFGSSPRELSLGAWPSFRRQPSYRRSGSSDCRLNFNVGGGNPSGSRCNSMGDTQQSQHQLLGHQHQQPSAAESPSPPPPAAWPVATRQRDVTTGQVGDTRHASSTPLPISTAAGSGNEGFQEYTNPLAGLPPDAELPGNSPLQSASPRFASNPMDCLLGGPALPQGTERDPSQGQGQGQGQADGPPSQGRSPRMYAAWPSPPPAPQLPPTIPEEIFSHSPTSPALQLSSHSSTAGSAVGGIAQALGRQGQDQQQLGRQLLGRTSREVDGGSRHGSESGSALGADWVPPRGGWPAGSAPMALSPSSEATGGMPVEPTAAGAAGSVGPEAEPYCRPMTVAAAGAALLAPDGSSGGSSNARESSERPIQLTVAMAMDSAAATAAAGGRRAAPVSPSHAAAPPSERLLRAGWEAFPGSSLSQVQPQLLVQPHYHGGAPGGGERACAVGAWSYSHASVSQDLRLGAEPASSYLPPSLESIQRLLDTDLPSPAIAAAVAVLAGSLPQGWVRPPPSLARPPAEQGWSPSTVQRPAAGRGAAASPALGAATPAVAEAPSPRTSLAAVGLYPDAHGAGPSTSAAGAGLAYVGTGRSAPMTRSYMALLTLAGERGMPPKPLQEDTDPLPPLAAAGPLPGPATGGQAVEGTREEPAASRDGVGNTPRTGLGHLVDGPLGRAVRLIAQSMLIVLAGAAGATAAASSANAIFMRPEDLPYEHGTSIYYTKYPRNRRFARTHNIS